ncbi:hypothetical protein, partial [Phascolarctobacterium succinatutens]|uniref:hypothetical protein n=1 Tax=Phascolarctobacterium succinatutens TaxID=626940 RepID=UPI0026EE0566
KPNHTNVRAHTTTFGGHPKKPRLVWQPKRGFFFGFLGFWILGFYNVPHKWQKEDKINNTKKGDAIE